MFGRKSYTVHYEIPDRGDYIKGTIEPGNYRFNALIFGEPSEYGIDKGRISKLQILDQRGREVVAYQRGFAGGHERPEKLSKTQTQLIDALQKEFPADKSWTPDQQAAWDKAEAADEARRAEKPATPDPAQQDPDIDPNPMGFFMKGKESTALPKKSETTSLTPEERAARREANIAARAEQDASYEKDGGRTM